MHPKQPPSDCELRRVGPWPQVFWDLNLLLPLDHLIHERQPGWTSIPASSQTFGLRFAIQLCRERPAICIREPNESRLRSATGGWRGQCYYGGSPHRSSDPEWTGRELVVGVIVREIGLWQCRERGGVVMR